MPDGTGSNLDVGSNTYTIQRRHDYGPVTYNVLLFSRVWVSMPMGL